MPPPRIAWAGPPSPAETWPLALYWVHCPKTGTAFSRTILSHGCGPHARGVATASTRAPADVVGTCGGNLSSVQYSFPPLYSLHYRWHHQPVPWRKVLTAELPQPQPLASGVGRVALLLRDPAQRILSMHSHLWQETGGGKDPGMTKCCGIGTAWSHTGNSWGWDRTTRFAALNATCGQNGDFSRSLGALLRALEARSALHGCMTKMVLGRGCHERRELGSADVALASSALRSPAFFVGLSERYVESVCYWHARFGGPVYHFEVAPEVLAASHRRHDESALAIAGFASVDSGFDGELVRSAKAHFADELAAHAREVRACAAAVGGALHAQASSGQVGSV